MLVLKEFYGFIICTVKKNMGKNAIYFPIQGLNSSST